MQHSHKEIYNLLSQIFYSYKKHYKNPAKSTQLCCMWSITSPPDIIEGTPPFRDIELAFNISIDEDDSLELYDMDIDEATDKIADMIQKQY